MKQLDNSILLLQKSQYHAIKVEYADAFGTFNAIENNATEAVLTTKYGSIKDFFEGLNAKGVKKIRITDRKANGSTFKTIGAAYEVSFDSSNTPLEIPTALQVQPATVHQATPILNQGLAGMGGLGFADIHRIHDYSRLEKDNARLEAKVEQLTASNEKLKEENFKNEILGVKKLEQTEAHAKLMGSGTAYIPLIQSILTGMKGQAAAIQEVGLGNPTMSPLQNQFLQFVQQADDAFLQDLNPVIAGMQIDAFDVELTELLKKFNLITAA